MKKRALVSTRARTSRGSKAKMRGGDRTYPPPAAAAAAAAAPAALPRADQQVPRMRIPVDHPVQAALLRERLHQEVPDLPGRKTEGLQTRQVVHLGGAADPLGDQHAPSRELVVDAGHVDPGPARKMGRQPLRVAGLVAEVELVLQVGPQLRQDPAALEEPGREGPVGDPREQGQDLEVSGDLPRQARVLDLHRHVGAVGEHRVVHLGQRRGRGRGRVDLSKETGGPGAEGLGQGPPHLPDGPGQGLILQPTEHLAVLGGDVAEAREELPGLDVHAAVPLGQGVEPVGAPGVHLR